MHSEYLRKLFLNNELATGHYIVADRPIALTDITVPIFAVGTEKDHVAPWKSVYKLHLLTDTEITFCLTTGGHNAGIVSEPGHKNRFYRIATTGAKDKYIDPELWVAKTPSTEGSWWTSWVKWLDSKSTKNIAAPTMGNNKAGYPVLDNAPGKYILMP